MPQDMPKQCDGCVTEELTVEHARSCKKGGLVHTRHDVVADEWRNLCGIGFAFGRVEREPLIYRCANPTQIETETVDGEEEGREEGEGRTTDEGEETEEEDKEDEEGEETEKEPKIGGKTNIKGEASCYGFWLRGRDTIFDIRITDTDAKSHQKTEPTKVLEIQEKEKKTKYLAHLHEQRKDFTPMVYSVDGIAGKETKRAEKHLAAVLAAKWKREYSEMVYYVGVRMALAVVRANSLLIYGSRVRKKPRPPINSDRAALQEWNYWHDD